MSEIVSRINHVSLVLRILGVSMLTLALPTLVTLVVAPQFTSQALNKS
jgi:hypothetical protein